MQLLSISRQTIQLDIEKTDAQLEMRTYSPQITAQRERNGLSIQHEPIRLQLDNTQLHTSMGMPDAAVLVEELARVAKQTAFEAVGRAVEEGNEYVKYDVKFSDIAYQRVNNTLENNINFVPAAPQAEWTGGDLKMDFVPDKLSLNWNIRSPEIQFKPAEMKFSVKQYNQLTITYLGKPNYVPPSADPDVRLAKAMELPNQTREE